MTKLLSHGLLCLCLLTTLSACAPRSEIVRDQAVALPPAPSPKADPRDLAPTAVTLPQPTLTGNLPLIVNKLSKALDTCNADKAKVAQDLELIPPN